MAVRAVEGAGFAAYLTSSLAVLVRTFPSNPGYYVGLTETIVTVAMISGPPLGSFLYTVGGYSAPFVSFGSVIIVMSIASYFLISEEKSGSFDMRSELGSLKLKEYLRILKMPAGAMVLVCVTLNVTADAFILIALSEHLSQFQLTPMVVGSIYLCLFLSYGLSSPLAGKIGDKMGGEFLLESGGCLIIALSFIFIGPGSFLEMKPKVGLIVAGLLLKGIGAGPLISCSYSAALKAAKQSGLPEDFRTYSLVSTLVSFSIPLGNLLGGVTTGMMTENLGMRPSTTLYAGIFLFLAVICLVVHFYEPHSQKKKQEQKWQQMKQNLIRSEEMPLIKKTKDIYKAQENGQIIPQNGFCHANQCSFPLQVTEINGPVIPQNKLYHENQYSLPHQVTEIKELGCENNPKMQCLENASQEKNFWLT